MCGISGFLHQQAGHTQTTIHKMLQCQHHRGPNANGYFTDTFQNLELCMGHNRLAIMDLSSHANQPMQFDNLVIVYNGEIYNFDTIKHSLSKEGYTFDSTSDTEIVLKAFHRWGMHCLEMFRGMFAFTIYDKTKKKLYLIRDRAGVKPLYYYQEKGLFMFASELKTFRCHPQFKGQLDAQSLRSFLQFGYIPSPHAIYQNTHKLLPGHFLEYDCLTTKLSQYQYWQLDEFYARPKLQITEPEAENHLEALFQEAFKLRLIADVPVGVFLSGGIDSSLVAAILQKNTKTRINTFTIGFEKKDYDESHHARRIAEHLKTDHHEQVCTWKEAKGIIETLPLMYDEPFADSSAIPTALLSQFTKNEVGVALSGDGGDELFCGYTSYLLNNKRFRLLNKIPMKHQLKKLLDWLPEPMFTMYRLNYDKYSRYLKIKSTLSLTDINAKYRTTTQTFTRYDLDALLLMNDIVDVKMQHFPFSPVEIMMMQDFNCYLPDNLMVKVDRASMFYSLEGREPLLDHKILEFTAQLPLAFKKNKKILKNILARYLPKEFFERKKQGFGIPINQWLREDLRFLIRKYLDKDKINRQGLFNSKYISAIINAFHHSTTDDMRLWTLISFQMWYEMYMEPIF